MIAWIMIAVLAIFVAFLIRAAMTGPFSGDPWE